MLKRFGMELNPVSGEHGDPSRLGATVPLCTPFHTVRSRRSRQRTRRFLQRTTAA